MQALIDAALNDRWGAVAVGQQFLTPDDASGKTFTVTSVSGTAITVATGGGTPIALNRAAFAAAIGHLLQHRHVGPQSRCNIESNKDIGRAGPLCVAARNANGVNVMVITYVLPLLAHMGLVEVDGDRPNSVWLV